jgi:tetratricopeptide (TPR) repeat protein
MNLDDIHKLHGSIFHDSVQVAGIEQEVRSVEDAEERESLLFAVGTRLVDEWVLDEAEHLARSMQSVIEKTWLFGQVASKLRQLGLKDYALRLLNEALALAYSLDAETTSDRERAETLTRIAARLIELGEVDTATKVLREAQIIAKHGKGDIEASSVLWEIAENYVLAKQWEEARQVASAIEFDIKRVRAVTRVEKMISIANKQSAA